MTPCNKKVRASSPSSVVFTVSNACCCSIVSFCLTSCSNTRSANGSLSISASYFSTYPFLISASRLEFENPISLISFKKTICCCSSNKYAYKSYCFIYFSNFANTSSGWYPWIIFTARCVFFFNFCDNNVTSRMSPLFNNCTNSAKSLFFCASLYK